jgi:hypothetical protein
MSPRALSISVLLAALLALAALGVTAAAAAAEEGLADDGGASWRLEQPSAPAPPPGVEPAPVPIGLGSIGDIEFYAPNRGLLITSGESPTIPPGVWVYNGNSWRELANKCGATHGRIAWAGADDFWTVSDGRPGQQANEHGVLPPLEDNTLCHFNNGKIETSYASLAFRADSYQAMNAAGCISESDCWFGGGALPDEPDEAFQLHWNGSSVSAEPYPREGHAIEDMSPFEGHLYESVRILNTDGTGSGVNNSEPSVLHLIAPIGQQPTFTSLSPKSLDLYFEGLVTIENEGRKETVFREEFPDALEFLHLSAAEGSLWAAAGPQEEEPPKGSAPAQVTVDRLSGERWTPLIGPNAPTLGSSAFPDDRVDAIAAEPGSDAAWIAVSKLVEHPSPTAEAIVARVQANGTVSDVEHLGHTGAAMQIVCPAAHDCWMATAGGWLYHLATETERQLPEDTSFAFKPLITERPEDTGVPPVIPDAPPPDDSGAPGEAPPITLPPVELHNETRVAVPLLSAIHARLVHGTTLELRFHLATKARVRLVASVVAKRHARVVASTSTHTFAAGARKLMLRLDRHRWPNKLILETRALGPLPTASTRELGTNTVSTGLHVLPSTHTFQGLDALL